MENIVKKKASFAAIPRVPSGVFGFDDMAEGGFEKNSLNLICGETGSGKSLFAFEFAYMGAQKYNDNSIFISLEESRDELIRRMGRFGFDPTGLEASGKLFIYSYSPKEVNKFIEDLPQIETIIKKNRISRLSFDSITTYGAFFESAGKRSIEVLSLMDKLRKLDCTVVATSELKLPSKVTEAEEGLTFDNLADSVIAIYSTRQKDVREFGLEIVKMRGTNHSRKIAPMRIIASGIILYPDMPFTK